MNLKDWETLNTLLRDAAGHLNEEGHELVSDISMGVHLDDDMTHEIARIWAASQAVESCIATLELTDRIEAP